MQAKNHYYAFLLSLCAMLLFTACGDDDDNGLIVPSTYDGANFEANAAVENAVRTQLADLTSAAKAGRSAGTTVDFNTLTQLYQQGSPSLEAITTTYYAGRMTGTDGWLNELAKASGGAYTPGEPTGEGGVYGGYLFDEHGLELEQLIEKGSFGAALYNHAITLMEGEITPAAVDRMVSIFGANPDFPNTDNSASTGNPDVYMAKYAARRDKNDGNGLYTRIRDAFILLQAAAAEDRFVAEQEAALADIKELWEKANAATVINYLHTTITVLSGTNPSDNEKGGAMHAYGEAVGFLHGWRTLPAEYRIITDQQIDELLVLMNAPHDAEPTSYLLLTDPVNELPDLSEAINTLQTIYGFSDQEIEDFRKNWVSEQGR